jgi:hypothetical protein
MRLRLALSDTKTSHAPCVTALRTGSVTAPACAHVAVTRNGTTASVLCLRPEQVAGLSPEIEKVGFSHLAPKSMVGRRMVPVQSGRREADVCVPSSGLHGSF